MTRQLLRALAVGIALAAIIDPAVTSRRTTKPLVAIVVADSARDSALAGRVARELAATFTVIPASFAGADATVLVGDHLPGADEAVAPPVIAVAGNVDSPAVTLEEVRAPPRSPLEARVPMTVVVRATGARGRSLEVSLRAGSDSGAAVVDHATRTLARDDERVMLPLTFVPTAAGAALLRVDAVIAGTRADAKADVVVDVHDTRWNVLFFDPRPSWMSTFVRRAVESDPRFVVTSRVVTSRGISTDAGRPPDRLDDIAGLARFDAVVVGAPEALTDADVVGLETFLRRRAGSVVLLLDRRASGPYERLAGVGAWRDEEPRRDVPITLAAADSLAGAGGLRASELAWPSPLPAGAEVVARTSPSPSDTTSSRPVIWRAPVGAGRLVVSGALDAWRFRDPSVSAFERFWPMLIAATAGAAPPPVAIAVSRAPVAPNEWEAASVTLRDAVLDAAGMDAPAAPPPARAVRTSVTAALEPTAGAAGGASPGASVRLWPEGDVGRLRADFRAPPVPGVYRLVVTGDGYRAAVPVVVARRVARPTPDEHDLLLAWTAARGGSVIPASRLGDLRAALRRTLHPTPRLETWHPMRSAWWIVPFALTLSAEWWLRRRRGLA